MRGAPLSLSFVAASLLMLVACAGGGENKPKTGTAGTAGTTGTQSGAAGTGSAGTTASGAAGSGAGTAGSGSSGVAGSGATGTAGSGAGGSSAGGTGAAGTGTDGGAGSSNNDGSTHLVDGAPVTSAGCANHNYQLCIDFENGIDTTTWSGGNAAAVETTHVAHGAHAYHLYSMAGQPAGGVLYTTKLGTLSNQIWGRVYVHFQPGAPGNHGNLIAAYDGLPTAPPNVTFKGNWYEMGWQFDGIMGVFHLANNMERPLRSMPLIVDQWYCLEFLFDGSKTDMQRWWINGQEAAYYMPGGGPAVIQIPQFKTVTFGFTPYGKLDLKMPDGKGDQTETRVLTDAWIDDVAFDTQRIGCIE
jgi:hypothetical protein